MTTKEELHAEAALILEQECWLVVRAAHENPHSGRLRGFAERYQAWQKKVVDFRAQHGAEAWPVPEDNS